MVRAPVNRIIIEQSSKMIESLVNRIFLVWFAGIAVGLIHIKVDHVSMSGIQYSIEKPGMLQGLLFIVCLLMYGLLAFQLVSLQVLTHTPGGWLCRRCVYFALGRTRTLVDRRDVASVKKRARIIYRVFGTCFLLIVFMPALQIFLYENGPVFNALDAIFPPVYPHPMKSG